jgi:hypothetical protein
MSKDPSIPHFLQNIDPQPPHHAQIAIMPSKCYGIDGTPYATLDRYIPCNSTTSGHTSCCAPGDSCLTNGLCQGPADNKRKANIFWRNGCTDPTWNDPACAKVCDGIGNTPLS